MFKEPERTVEKDNIFKCLKRISHNMEDNLDESVDELYKNFRGGGPGSGRDYRRPKDVKGTLLRILGYAVKNKLLFAGILLLMALAAILSLDASYLMKPIIDDFIIPQITAEVKDYSALGIQLLKLLGIYFVSAAATYIQSRSLVNLGQRAVGQMRRDLFSKLQDLPITFYDEHTHGELMSRFTNDADNVQMALEQGMTQVLSGIITFLGTVILMVVISWKLCIVTFVTVAISMLVVSKLGSFSKIMFKKQQAALGRMNGYIEEMTEGLKVVKAFNYEQRAIEEFDQLDAQYRENAIMANFLGMMSMPILAALMNLCYAVTAAIGGAMVMTNTFTIGSLGVFLNYTRQISMPLNMISNQIVNLMSAVAGAERVFAIIDADPETDEGRVTLVTAVFGEDGELTETDDGRRTGTWAWKIPTQDGGAEYREVRGDVRLNDVHFSYVPGKPVLKGISVYAKPGQKIAFVGSTGAGKTTITNLINRFYEIDSGSITFDGIDITEIHKAGLRRSLGVVLQDTNLFTGTIMDNIRYGKLDATDEECIEAAKSANAHGFISRLPDGYNTWITGNGGNLSQGQRQLLAIARTAVAKHPVMVLDEATSSIDTRTEKLIEKGLDMLMENKTVFVIAHRLSTVRNAKAIAVIEHGEIIEKGSHEELLALGGRYYMLYTGQHALD